MDEVVASIERATLDAVPPAAREEVGPWLVALDAGPVGRAHSAAPLVHAPEAADPAHRDGIERCFARQGLAPVYRLPALPAFEPFRRSLEGDGFTASKPARVQRCEVAGLLASLSLSRTAEGPHAVQLQTAPDAAWGAVFMGQGFDPVDARLRLDLLGRAGNAVFATALREGRAVAVGAACLAQGWLGIHAMRTAPDHRHQGLARSILLALARQARQRGVGRAFLQVETGNAPALALYRAVGFTDAWDYAYWRRGG